MTALAAYWRWGGAAEASDVACDRMLRGQQIYGRNRAVSNLPPVALGRLLFPLLPEDSCDLGPVAGGGGRWTLVADVRLDDREELCSELGIAAEWKSLSDAAIVMRAIERWEDAAIGRLIGDFALILWDSREQRLILARDFMGQKPLHYHRSSGFFAAASMPKGLHALPDVPMEPDDSRVAEFLALFPDRTPKSFYRHVSRVLPGEMVVVTRDRVQRSDHWTFQPKPLRLGDDEYLEATRETFDRAVSARLRGTSSAVGTQLSGGLDSSVVAATAARLMPSRGKVIAFTAAPREGYSEGERTGRFIDESDHAAAVAALYPNMEHVIVRGSGKSPFRTLDRNFFLYDRPVLNICNNVWFDDILDQARSRRLHVLLTGTMGNVTISYDGMERLAELVGGGRLMRALTELRLLRRHGIALRTAGAKAIGPLLPRPLWSTILRLTGRKPGLSHYTLLPSGTARSLEKQARDRQLDTSWQPGRDGFAARRSGLQWVDDGNMNKGCLGGWQIDIRDPTADRRLVELCLSIPADQFMRAGTPRLLARRAFADRLPGLVANESRKGYQAADWHEGFRAGWSEASDEVERLKSVPGADTALDVEKVEELMDTSEEVDWTSPEAERDYRLRLLRGLSAGHFLRKATGAN